MLVLHTSTFLALNAISKNKVKTNKQTHHALWVVWNVFMTVKSEAHSFLKPQHGTAGNLQNSDPTLLFVLVVTCSCCTSC